MSDDDDQGREGTGTTSVVDAPDVLTVDEAATFLRVGRNQVYEAIGRGDLPHRRIGRSIRLSRAALVRWLDRSCGPASEQGTI